MHAAHGSVGDAIEYELTATQSHKLKVGGIRGNVHYPVSIGLRRYRAAAFVNWPENKKSG